MDGADEKEIHHYISLWRVDMGMLLLFSLRLGLIVKG
jgi:hypothetical protein